MPHGYWNRTTVYFVVYVKQLKQSQPKELWKGQRKHRKLRFQASNCKNFHVCCLDQMKCSISNFHDDSQISSEMEKHERGKIFFNPKPREKHLNPISWSKNSTAEFRNFELWAHLLKSKDLKNQMCKDATLEQVMIKEKFKFYILWGDSSNKKITFRSSKLFGCKK